MKRKHNEDAEEIVKKYLDWHNAEERMDPSHFVESKQELEQLDVLCGICLNVCQKPIYTECFHTFCEHCIDECHRFNKPCPICKKSLYNSSGKTYKLNEPLYNTIRTKLTMNCDGCNVRAPMTRMQDHCNSQRHLMAVKRCGQCFDKHKNTLEDHVQNDCPNTPQTCKTCQLVFERKQMARHTPKCEMIVCECDMRIKKIDVLVHADVCMEAQVICTFVGCRTLMKRYQLYDHAAKETLKHSILQSWYETSVRDHTGLFYNPHGDQLFFNDLIMTPRNGPVRFIGDHCDNLKVQLLTGTRQKEYILIQRDDVKDFEYNCLVCAILTESKCEHDKTSTVPPEMERNDHNIQWNTILKDKAFRKTFPGWTCCGVQFRDKDQCLSPVAASWGQSFPFTDMQETAINQMCEATMRHDNRVDQAVQSAIQRS